MPDRNDYSVDNILAEAKQLKQNKAGTGQTARYQKESEIEEILAFSRGARSAEQRTPRADSLFRQPQATEATAQGARRTEPPEDAVFHVRPIKSGFSYKTHPEQPAAQTGRMAGTAVKERPDHQKTQMMPPVQEKKTALLKSNTAELPLQPGKDKQKRIYQNYKRAYSATHPQTIERPAIIKTESKFDRTGDLAAVPTLLPAETEADLQALFPEQAEEKTLIKESARQELERKLEAGKDIDGQIRLKGFEEVSPEPVSEEEVEQALEENRKTRVDSFKFNLDDYLSEPEETADAEEEVLEEQDDYVVVKKKKQIQPEQDDDRISDYNSRADGRSIFLELSAKRGKLAWRLMMLGMIEIALLAVNLVGSGLGIFETAAESFGVDGANSELYIAINLGLLLLMVLFSGKTVFKGFFMTFSRRANADSPAAFATVLTIVQCVAVLILKDNADLSIHIYPCLAGLGLFLNAWGKYSILKRTFGNFKVLLAKNNLYNIRMIDHDGQANEMGRGLMMETPDIRYNGKAGFPSEFLKTSYTSDPADKLSKSYTIWGALASIVVCLASFLLTRNLLTALTAAAATACIATPVSSLLAANLPLTKANQALNEEGAALCGFSAVNDIAQTDAVILESADLFPSGTCTIHGMKLFCGMRIDEAITYTAGTILSADGPLGEVFLRVIEGKTELLPPVESVVYEERMGISAWIYGQRVLVGSAELMRRHDVHMPDDINEAQYLHDNRKVLYLAVAGKLSALFVVSYAADDIIAYELQRLEGSSVNILVKTSDPNLTETMLADTFGLLENSMRILSSVSGSFYEKRQQKTPESTPATFVNKGSFLTFVRGVTAACILKGQITAIQIVQILSLGLGIALVAFFSLYQGLTQLSAINLFVYQLFWCVIACLIPKFSRAAPPLYQE